MTGKPISDDRAAGAAVVISLDDARRRRQLRRTPAPTIRPTTGGDAA